MKHDNSLAGWAGRLALVTALFASVSLSVSASTSPGIGTEGPDGKSSIRRFALTIGSNFGGTGRDTLLYAGTDAKAFAKVMTEMGGVLGADVHHLAEPTPDELDKALKDLKKRVAASRSQSGRTEVILYYSGHADARGLLLGEHRFPYDTFRQRVDSIPADVRIAVLDACASGAITRLKGGRHRPAFTVDASSNMRGYAFITSSSPEEASQESDLTGSSFFTHYLVSGLRGAADVSGDGKVTLGEAYQFAFHETLARTERTKGGPQHPAYDMNLSGTGDVVMTDMRETTASLELDKELEGRLFIRNAQGRLAAELFKPRGRSMSLGLPSGDYNLMLQQGKSWSSATVVLKDGARELLASKHLQAVSRTATRSRGDGPDVEDGAEVVHVADGADAAGESTPISNVAANHVEIGGPLSLGFILNREKHPYRGLQLAILFNHASQTMQGGQLAVLGNSTRGEMSGFQGAAVANLAMSNVKGGQGAAVANIAAGDVRGGQGAAVLNVSKSLHGGQGAAVANIAFGDVRGGQAAAVLNVARNLEGAQVAAVANVSAGNAQGAQAAAVLNATRDMQGVQASAVLNVARDVVGFQIGLVNISRDIRGGIPIGLINYSHTGLHNANTWTDELGIQYFSLASGSRNFYTTISVGEKLLSDRSVLLTGLGLGVQVPWNGYFGALELGVQDIHVDYDFDSAVPELYRVKFQMGREVIPYVSVFGGLSANVLWDREREAAVFPWGDYQGRIAENVHAWPGIFAGIRLGK